MLPNGERKPTLQTVPLFHLQAVAYTEMTVVIPSDNEMHGASQASCLSTIAVLEQSFGQLIRIGCVAAQWEKVLAVTCTRFRFPGLDVPPKPTEPSIPRDRLE